jgi:hypothetical protein
LARLKKLAAAQANTPAAYESRQAAHRAERETWKRKYIDGGPEAAGPMPDGGVTAEQRKWSEMTLRGDACQIARIERKIGPLEYLPGMDYRARALADWMAGTFYRIERSLAIGAGIDPDEATADYPPEWATLEGPEFQTLGTLIAHRAAEEEDLTKLTDEELEERIAEARREMAEAGVGTVPTQ